jgi:hypothetical protein
MWYIGKNYYCPEDPDFELIKLDTKEQVENYLLEFIREMSTYDGDIDNAVFYHEINKRLESTTQPRSRFFRNPFVSE